MKLVTAIIKPHQLDNVREALQNIGVQAMTVTEVKGFGRQGGHTETYRGAEYRIDFVPKIKLEIVADTGMADEAARVIRETADTGTIGDGKIWIVGVRRRDPDPHR